MARLVSMSSGEVIQVTEGESSIGRGPLLKVNDKRVSRNHALLSLKDGKFSICPKHINPCFLKPDGQTAYIRLVKDQWQDLHCQDHFSLLPKGELTFKVISDPSYVDRVSSSDPPKSLMAISAQSQTPTPAILNTDCSHGDPTVDDMLFGNMSPKAAHNRTDPEESNFKDHSHQDEKIEKLFSVTVSDKDTTMTSLSISSSCTKDSKSKYSPTELTKSSSSGKRRVLPGWLGSASTTERPTSTTSREAPKKTQKGGSMTTKRAVTKRKMADRSPTSSLPSAKDDNRNTTAATTPSNSEETSVKTADDDKGRPSCPYGTKCYRKNPDHFRDYSHDFVAKSDSDDGGGGEERSDKPVCCYGAQCYRMNPEHRREYSHFTGSSDKGAATTRTPAGTRKRAKKGTKKSVLAGDSDNDDQPNNYDYQDSFIDDHFSSGSSSSYGNDSEDSEWVVPAGEKGGTEEEEDLDELITEADEFMSNAKMMK